MTDRVRSAQESPILLALEGLLYAHVAWMTGVDRDGLLARAANDAQANLYAAIDAFAARQREAKDA